jgi:hypothetical protein
MTANPALGPNVGFTVVESATGRVAKTTGADPVEADWKSTSPGFFGPEYPQMIFSNNDVLWVEVKLETFTNYYKIVVTVTP